MNIFDMDLVAKSDPEIPCVSAHSEKMAKLEDTFAIYFSVPKMHGAQLCCDFRWAEGASEFDQLWESGHNTQWAHVERLAGEKSVISPLAAREKNVS